MDVLILVRHITDSGDFESRLSGSKSVHDYKWLAAFANANTVTLYGVQTAYLLHIIHTPYIHACIVVINWYVCTYIHMYQVFIDTDSYSIRSI